MSSAAVMNNKLFVTGGDDEFYVLDRTEVLTLNKNSLDVDYGPDLPIRLSHHCLIQISDTKVLATGGITTWSVVDRTFEFDSIRLALPSKFIMKKLPAR